MPIDTAYPFPRDTTRAAPRDDRPAQERPGAADRAREWAIWEGLLDIGAIPNRNPPPAPETAAIRDANDALFRRNAPRRMCFGPSWVR